MLHHHCRNYLVHRTTACMGAALVEIAITLPIILLMVAGFLELSRVWMLKHSSDTAAYEGARAGIVAGANPTQATAAAEALLRASGIKNWRIQVSPNELTESTPCVNVTVEIAMASNTWIPPFFFKQSTVRSSVTLITERPAAIQLSGLDGSAGLGLGVSALGLGL